MKNESLVAKHRSRQKRLLNVLFLVSGSLLALYFGARVMWRLSGSNQWELVAEGNGAKVYTLKEPGSDLRQVKESVRVRSTLAGVVAWLQDSETCKDAGCHEPRTIEQVDDQLQYVSMQYDM